MTLRSYLAKYQPKQKSQEELHGMKRDGWLKDRILVVMPEDAGRLTAIEQQVVEKIGLKLYGRVINGR